MLDRGQGKLCLERRGAVARRLSWCDRVSLLKKSSNKREGKMNARSVARALAVLKTVAGIRPGP